MSRPPVTGPGPGMGLLASGVIAAVTGGVVAATLVCWGDSRVDITTYAGMVFFSVLIALFLGGLAAPPLAKWTIGGGSVSWVNSAITSTLTAALPATLFVLVRAPFINWGDESFPIADTLNGLSMLALSGAGAGLVFRALYGARPIEPR
ncbi:hypothetical protein [Sphingomonas sp.]|uniref:hypothetical protein n=1 Tax=Sphingomonas sp. TaxID=28214 RepID=UPI0025F4E72A|nr:hypothetical protein [Sphingomonas sp.]